MAKVAKVISVTAKPATQKQDRLAILNKYNLITGALPCCSIVTITPSMAQELLECHVYNRKLNSTSKYEYANMMQRGKFDLSPDAITFDEDGHLTNGHHRLEACVMAGVDITVIIAVGINFSPDIDTGRKRSLLDNIKLFGYGIDERLRTSNIVSVARNCCRYKSKTKKATYDEIIDFMVHYQKELLDLADVIGGKNGTCWHRAALFMMYIGNVDKSIPYSGKAVKPSLNEIKEWYSVFVSDSSNLPKHNPIRAAYTATKNLFAGGYGGSDAHKKEIISITQDSMCQFINNTCTNVLDQFIPESLFNYDMNFLNYDLNNKLMDQKKYR